MNSGGRRDTRDRLVNRVSVMGQLSALVAMASTGLTAGVLAHDAQVKDRLAAEAPVPAPVVAAPVRLVPKPIRTVVVRVPAPARKSARRSTVVRRSTTQAAPRRVVRAAPAPVRAAAPVRVRMPAPRPASKPAATTSTGS